MEIWGDFNAHSPAAKYRPSLENVQQENGFDVGELKKCVCLLSLGL